jgi:hypothetical protein
VFVARKNEREKAVFGSGLSRNHAFSMKKKLFFTLISEAGTISFLLCFLLHDPLETIARKARTTLFLDPGLHR